MRIRGAVLVGLFLVLFYPVANAAELVGIKILPSQVPPGENVSITFHVRQGDHVTRAEGTVVGPSGDAFLNFTAADAGNGRWMATVALPQDADPGVWYIGGVTLVDSDRRTLALAYTPDTVGSSGKFEVEAIGQHRERPEVRSVTAQYRTERGRAIHEIEVILRDPEVVALGGTFISPSRNSRVAFRAERRNPARWSAVIELPRFAECGSWSMESLEITDFAGRRTMLASTDRVLDRVGLDVPFTSSCDGVKPTVESARLARGGVGKGLTLTSDDEPLVATVVVSDESGVAAVNGRLDGAPPPEDEEGLIQPTIYFAFQRSNAPNEWTATVHVPFGTTEDWVLGWLQVTDLANNVTNIVPGGVEP